MLISLYPLVPVTAQMMSPITTRIARAIRYKEPSWQYSAGHCTCPPLVPSQISHDVGDWERKDKSGNREFVNMDIYRIKSLDEVTGWMAQFARPRQTGGRCQVEPYPIGDEGYLYKCPTSYKSLVYFRKGHLIVHVKGDSEMIVQRFARYSVRLLATTGQQTKPKYAAQY